MRRDLAMALTCAGMALAAAPASARSPAPGLGWAPLAGARACLSTDGRAGDGRASRPCQRASVGSGGEIVLARSGRRAYVASRSGVVVLQRDGRDGALVALRCSRPVSARCPEPADRAIAGVASSADGRTLLTRRYGLSSHAGVGRLAVTARGLRARGCLAFATREGCAVLRLPGVGFDALVVAPDGRRAYAANGAFGFAPTLAVIGLAGARSLVQRGCLASDNLYGGERFPRSPPFSNDRSRCGPGPDTGQPGHLAVSPDGRDLYLQSTLFPGLSQFDLRDDPDRPRPAGCERPARRRCEDLRDYDSPPRRSTNGGLIVDPGGRFVFASTYEGIAAYRRDRATGTLTLSDCAGADSAGSGPWPSCPAVRSLDTPGAIALSRSGRRLLAVQDGGVVAFAFDRRRGKLRLDGCIERPSTYSRRGCSTSRALPAGDVALAGDGRSLYLTAVGSDLLDSGDPRLLAMSLAPAIAIDDAHLGGPRVRAVGVRLRCPRPLRRCGGRVSLVRRTNRPAPALAVARGAYELAGGSTRTVTLAVDRAVADALPKRARRLTVIATDASGRVEPVARAFALAD